MAPDPSIIRVEDTYYLATSTFHWQPAIQIYESKDLANWKLVNYALKSGQVNLQGTNTPAGIWAPHLSYDSSSKNIVWLIPIWSIWEDVSLMLTHILCLRIALVVHGQIQFL